MTYKAQRYGWGVSPGVTENAMFHTKTIRPGDDLLLDFEYPAARKSRYASIVDHLIACFESSRPYKR